MRLGRRNDHVYAWVPSGVHGRACSCHARPEEISSEGLGLEADLTDYVVMAIDAPGPPAGSGCIALVLGCARRGRRKISWGKNLAEDAGGPPIFGEPSSRRGGSTFVCSFSASEASSLRQGRSSGVEKVEHGYRLSEPEKQYHASGTMIVRRWRRRRLRIIGDSEVDEGRTEECRVNGAFRSGWTRPHCSCESAG